MNNMNNWIDYNHIELNGSIQIKKLPVFSQPKSIFDITTEEVFSLDEAIAFVKERENQINGIITWLKENKSLLVEELIDAGIKDCAEDWTTDELELAGKEIDDDFKITNEAFRASLVICDIIVLDYDKDSFDNLFLEILFEPDYFHGHLVHVQLDKDKNIMVEGI